MTAPGLHPRRLLIACVLCIVLGVISRVAMPEEIPDISGTRTGLWSVPNSGGTVTLTVKQNDSTVTGDIAFKVDLKGEHSYSQGPISGTVSRTSGQYVLSFTGGRVRAELDISDAEIKGPFCMQICGTMSFRR